MKPTKNIGFLIQHIATSLARQNDSVLQEKFGIGFSQFKILMVLQWKPSIRQKRIAEELGQTEASVSRQIKLMYDDGLLQSVPRPDNRREHITTLTTRGVRLCNEALDELNQTYTPMLNRLSNHQQEELQKLLSVLHEYTCQISESGH